MVVAVIGHLRDVKDPLRAAEAARLLPAESRIRIEQVGRAYTPQWAARARAEMAANPRYRWRDDVPAGVRPHGCWRAATPWSSRPSAKAAPT